MCRNAIRVIIAVIIAAILWKDVSINYIIYLVEEAGVSRKYEIC